MFWQRRIGMYVVIIGCGRLGSNLARDLADMGNDVAIVDKYQEDLDRLGSGFNGQRIKGVEFDEDVLTEAGIDKAQVFLAMTPDDNINIMAAQIAKNIFQVPRVIARIFDPEREEIYKRLGLETISPTELAADIIKSRLMEEGLNILMAIDNNVSIVEVPLEIPVSKTVEEVQAKYSCVISGVIRLGKFLFPEKGFKMEQGDKMICTIDRFNMEKMMSVLSGGN